MKAKLQLEVQYLILTREGSRTGMLRLAVVGEPSVEDIAAMEQRCREQEGLPATDCLFIHVSPQIVSINGMPVSDPHWGGKQVG